MNVKVLEQFADGKTNVALVTVSGQKFAGKLTFENFSTVVFLTPNGAGGAVTVIDIEKIETLQFAR